MDFFESILKPKTFIDIVENLTIYIDEKNENGELKNIFLNDKSNTDETQTTFARTGVLEVRGEKKILVLYDGKTVNYVKGKISEFEFSKTDFNVTKFSSKTTVTKKTQETSTKDLLQCLKILTKSDNKKKLLKTRLSRNCGYDNLRNIYEELYSRLIKPLYATFLITISLLFILKSKNDHTYKINKLKIYFFGFLSIIFLESSSKFITTNFMQNLVFSILPFLFVFIIYMYFLITLKVNKT